MVDTDAGIAKLDRDSQCVCISASAPPAPPAQALVGAPHAAALAAAQCRVVVTESALPRGGEQCPAAMEPSPKCRSQAEAGARAVPLLRYDPGTRPHARERIGQI